MYLGDQFSEMKPKGFLSALKKQNNNNKNTQQCLHHDTDKENSIFSPYSLPLSTRDLEFASGLFLPKLS